MTIGNIETLTGAALLMTHGSETGEESRQALEAAAAAALCLARAAAISNNEGVGGGLQQEQPFACGSMRYDLVLKTGGLLMVHQQTPPSERRCVH